MVIFHHLGLKRFGAILALAGTVLASGCSLFQVYTIDIPQGTPITQMQAKQVQIGMTQSQVLYLLGSPAFRDTLEPNRWDYLYDFRAGTEGKREKKPDILAGKQHFTVYFDADKRVARLEGLSSLPVR